MRKKQFLIQFILAFTALLSCLVQLNATNNRSKIVSSTINGIETEFNTVNEDKPIRFAWLADTHIAENSKSIDNLRLCIRDINRNTRPDFVIVAGDITDFGSDRELELAKKILDSLQMPYYVVSGNHDAKWSESGCNSFLKIFGYEQFSFKIGSYRFLGCASGPNMRMAPALIPRSDMLWLSKMEREEKSIFINHYPIDSSILNYLELRKELKRLGTSLVLGGHWHKNTVLDYDGIPGLLGRSTLSTAKMPSGYNIVCLNGNDISIYERRVYSSSIVTMPAWYKGQICDTTQNPKDNELSTNSNDKAKDNKSQTNSDKSKNNELPTNNKAIKEIWSLQEDSDIASGFAYDGNKSVFYACCNGEIKAINLKGKRLWSTKLPGKVFSTPAYSNGIVVVGCTDNGIYALDAKNGKQIWKYNCKKSVLASPTIFDKVVYIGASDSCFRAINPSNGELIWCYEGVGAFVECKAFVDREQVVFGAWDKKLYSLERRTGKLMWKWEIDKGSRMYSPAACWPIKANSKIFIAAPDRRMYVIDAQTGKEVYHYEGGRESIGISNDKEMVFVKTMHNELYAINSSEKSADNALIWRIKSGLDYDISPTLLSTDDRYVYVPSDKGTISAFNLTDGSLVWEHQFSVALINPLLLITDRKGNTSIIASSMDGKITKSTAT